MCNNISDKMNNQPTTNFSRYQIRHVTANWTHPKKPDGTHRSLASHESYLSATASFRAHIVDLVNQGQYASRQEALTQLAQLAPQADHYMPYFSMPDHVQAYDLKKGGVPISPVFADVEDLLDYLVENLPLHEGVKGTHQDWRQELELSWNPRKAWPALGQPFSQGFHYGSGPFAEQSTVSPKKKPVRTKATPTVQAPGSGQVRDSRSTEKPTIDPTPILASEAPAAKGTLCPWPSHFFSTATTVSNTDLTAIPAY
ncbi:hypothetical protein SCOR_08145 [Sulfidibacter corallicola]|uniref:Uncharacterized protein n=1 Tax=Sulfidibacter corallicola TaxID=2818388 RepID=A0A8A4TQJ1_SULCO|nr:hypothetical protein [Sulfidibacter corallicola]QTD51268.1 hypothetical protein J3U87_02270 [Sulfidibacter corallicola]